MQYTASRPHALFHFFHQKETHPLENSIFSPERNISDEKQRQKWTGIKEEANFRPHQLFFPQLTMKVLVLVLSLALVVKKVILFCRIFSWNHFIQISAQSTTKGGKGIEAKPAPKVNAQSNKATPGGCDSPPVGVKVTDCCPSYPNYSSNKTVATTCTEKCKKTDSKKLFCCFTDCAMEYFGLTTAGKFDATKAKSVMAQLTHGLKGVTVTWTADVSYHVKNSFKKIISNFIIA